MIFNEADILLYLQNRLSPKKTEKFRQRMIQSPKFKKKVDDLSFILSLSDSMRQQRSIDTAKAWRKTSNHIKADVFRSKMWKISTIAATILLPLFVLFHYFIYPHWIQNKEEQFNTITSAPGIVTKTILPDGSHVWLNGESELVYPLPFHGKDRNVQLTGEAFFKVLSDKKHRFNVITQQGTKVSAYGTEFNVNAYDNETFCEITLVKGNVEVGQINSTATQILEVGNKAIVNQTLGSVSIAPVNTSVETAWKDGKMIFQREKLSKIAENLSRKFGVSIILESENLKEYEYTATFTNESLQEILELLKCSAPISYSISKQEQLDDNVFTKKRIVITNQ